MICWQVANISGVVKVLILLLSLLFFLSISVTEHTVGIYRLIVIHFLAILVVRSQEIIIYLLVWINSIAVVLILLVVIPLVHVFHFLAFNLL